MQQAQQYLLSILRNKDTPRNIFRATAHTLSRLLALRTVDHLHLTQKPITTPTGTTIGFSIQQRIVIIPILRSGMIMVDPFLEIFTQAYVGVVGLHRDEVTAKPHLYYEQFPEISQEDQIIIVDPMIATGGTGVAALKHLKERNANLQTLIFANIINAPEGIAHIKENFPEITIISAATDPGMNDKKFIVPGLGDFGDRYFGTEK